MKTTAPHWKTRTVAAMAVLAIAPVVDAQRGGDRNRGGDPGADRGAAAAIPVPSRRGERRGDRHATQAPPVGQTVEFPTEYPRIDGVGNNFANPSWGAAETPFLRRAPAAYADGASAPSGADRPGARAVSNAVAAASGDKPNAAGASDFVWQWGQFVDHDIDETPGADPTEAFDIPVPPGDPQFDPSGTGAASIGLNRSDYDEVGGVRQQVNAVTAYIDASNVYGSDEGRAFALRTLDGTGRLKTSAGDLLPFNTAGLPNAPTAAAPNFFLAGDVRANEQVGLTAMHTVFVREHNHWADAIATFSPGMSGEQIYQAARCIVAAEMQAITYNEFLPVLLGRDAIPEYRGYRPEVNAGITNTFATAAYRLGHSMLSGELLCLDADLTTVASGNLSLAESFFDPGLMTRIGPEPVLRGLCSQQCQEIDTELVDEVRNFLFGAPGAGGFDLAALNIQRGRDHGLPSYNGVRSAFGLRPARAFRDISPDPAVAARLASIYISPEDVDPWVGMLAEPHVGGGMVGETLRAVVGDQFRRLRDGDRFFYRSRLDPALVRMVEEQTLAVIIRRNTGIGNEIPDDVFRVVAPAGTPAPRAQPVRRRR